MLALLLAVMVAAPAFHWESLPLDGGGPVRCLAVSPHEQGLLLAGAEAGGLHLSGDGGHSWQPMPSCGRIEADRQVVAVVFHPTDPARAYAATAGGLLATADSGRTWVVRSRAVRFGATGPHRQHGEVLAIDPVRPGRLWAATVDDGVQLSEDGGANWRSLGLAGYGLQALVLTADNHCLVAAEARDTRAGGIFVSLGAGAWTPVYRGDVWALAATGKGRTLLAASPSAGLLRGEDLGRTWTNVSPPGFVQRLQASLVAGSASHPDIAVAGGLARPEQRYQPAFFLTLDGGRTWRPLTGDPPDNVTVNEGWLPAAQLGWEARCAVFDPSSPRRLYLADGLNVWGSHDGAGSWFSGHAGLRTAVVRHLCCDPANRSIAWFGADDIGVFRAGAAPLAVTPCGGNLFAVGTVAGLAAVATARGTVALMARGKGLWQQRGLGTWIAAPGAAPAPLGPLAVLPDGVIVAESAAGLQASADLGASWSRWVRPPHVGGLTARLGLPAALDTRGNHLAAVDPTRGLFMTTNAGLTWQPLQPPDMLRPPCRFTAVAARPGPSPTLFLATSQGLWQTTDSGAFWQRLLPQPVLAMAVDPASGRLLVAVVHTGEEAGRVTILGALPGADLEPIDADWPVGRTITQIVPGAGGRFWVATAGSGVLVGTPSSAPDRP